MDNGGDERVQYQAILLQYTACVPDHVIHATTMSSVDYRYNNGTAQPPAKPACLTWDPPIRDAIVGPLLRGSTPEGHGSTETIRLLQHGHSLIYVLRRGAIADIRTLYQLVYHSYHHIKNW